MVAPVELFQLEHPHFLGKGTADRLDFKNLFLPLINLNLLALEPKPEAAGPHFAVEFLRRFAVAVGAFGGLN